MKKKIRLFCTIATLCLCLAVFALGVYASTSVSYKTVGRLSYYVQSSSIEIETRIFSTSKRFADNTELGNQAKEFESSNFTILNSTTMLGTDTFNKVQIFNLDKGEEYEIQDTDFVYSYSSEETENPPADLKFNINYSVPKKVFTYFIITKIVNAGGVPIYVYVPTTGDEPYTTPTNTLNYKLENYKEISAGSSAYIVFAMSLDDITKDVINIQYLLPIAIVQNVQSIPQE